MSASSLDRSVTSSLMTGPPDLRDPVCLPERRILRGDQWQPLRSNAHRFVAREVSKTFTFACERSGGAGRGDRWLCVGSSSVTAMRITRCCNALGTQQDDAPGAF